MMAAYLYSGGGAFGIIIDVLVFVVVVVLLVWLIRTLLGR